ncbi:MAG: transposase, partial [Chloroflexota bacterium]
ALRELVRGRRRMVFSLTAVKNQIHALTDRLFPGFLDEKKSGIIAFSEASLALMEAAFSAPAVARRKPAALATLLCRGGCGETKAREKAAQLQECARSALAPEPSQVAAMQESLGSSVRLLRCTMDVIENLTAAMAEELSRLPAAFFTTLPGVGVVLASALAAELGAHLHTASFGRQCAYAGIVPRTSQTGGPGQPATQGAAPRQCNRILKDYLVQAASKQQQWGPPEFKAAYAQLQSRGQHADYIIARRVLRTLRALHRQHGPWLPPALRDENYTKTKAGRAARSAYYHDLLVKLTGKWRRGPRWTQYFGADRVLGSSLRTANSLCGFGLRFPERSAAAPSKPATSAGSSFSSTCDPDTADDEPG